MTKAAAGQKKIPRGEVDFGLQGDKETVAIQLDRQGFRRLLETLERLAATGNSQTFEWSGKSRRDPKPGSSEKEGKITRLVFHIETERS